MMTLGTNWMSCAAESARAPIGRRSWAKFSADQSWAQTRCTRITLVSRTASQRLRAHEECSLGCERLQTETAGEGGPADLGLGELLQFGSLPAELDVFAGPPRAARRSTGDCAARGPVEPGSAA